MSLQQAFVAVVAAFAMIAPASAETIRVAKTIGVIWALTPVDIAQQTGKFAREGIAVLSRDDNGRYTGLLKLCYTIANKRDDSGTLAQLEIARDRGQQQHATSWARCFICE